MSQGRKLPTILTEDEQQRVLSAPNVRYFTSHRNRTMMLLMLDAGLRSAESIALSTRAIDWTSGKIKVVQGKGSKDRILWINDDTLDALRDWRERMAHDLERRKVSTDVMFPTLNGTRLNAGYLRTAFARIGKRAGLDTRLHPHTLRHTFATDLYRETKNLVMTQKALGHASIATTTVYTHIVDDELEEGMKTFRRRNQEIAT